MYFYKTIQNVCSAWFTTAAVDTVDVNSSAELHEFFTIELSNQSS